MAKNQRIPGLVRGLGVGTWYGSNAKLSHDSRVLSQVSGLGTVNLADPVCHSLVLGLLAMMRSISLSCSVNR